MYRIIHFLRLIKNVQSDGTNVILVLANQSCYLDFPKILCFWVETALNEPGSFSLLTKNKEGLSRKSSSEHIYLKMVRCFRKLEIEKKEYEKWRVDCCINFKTFSFNIRILDSFPSSYSLGSSLSYHLAVVYQS